MATATENYRYTRLHIRYFDLDVPAVAQGRVVYFPIRAVCKAIGLAPQMQIERIRGDSRFRGGYRDLPIPTVKGLRPMVCIKKTLVSAWLGTADPAHVRLLRTREKLEQFQAELFAAADRFLWGKEEGGEPKVVEGTMVINGACPHCGGKLCVINGPDGVHFQALPGDPDEEE